MLIHPIAFQIGPACAALVAEGRQAGAIVFHCSGALA